VKPKDLKKYRQQEGLTQAELADLFGVHQAQISRWERDLQKIPTWLGLFVECLKRGS
jgi:transcriptional regulator with XRE-family HTH domain